MRDAVLHLLLHQVVSGITTKRNVAHNCTAIKHHLSFWFVTIFFVQPQHYAHRRLRIALLRWGGVVGGFSKVGQSYRYLVWPNRMDILGIYLLKEQQLILSCKS